MCKVVDMITAIKDIEGLIKQHLKQKIISSDEREFLPVRKLPKERTKDYKNIYKRWCTHCKSSTHDTNYCYKKRQLEDKKDYQAITKGSNEDKKDKKEAKKFIIKSTNALGLIEVPIQFRNHDKDSAVYNVIFDTGSENNYIGDSVVKKDKLPIVKVPQFNLISAVGQTVIDEKIDLSFNFLDDVNIFKEEFYITKESNFTIVLGKVFFTKHSCVYNFLTRVISIGKKWVKRNFPKKNTV
ncbi:hypothetical protein H311_01829 [Anncaliia algerae PRA109]|nr:hypothetical protein H311_01829 [Anncaliia algerae PRA109]